MKIHKEGRGFLTVLFFILLAINAGILILAPFGDVFKGIIGGVSLIVFLFFLQCLRNQLDGLGSENLA